MLTACSPTLNQRRNPDAKAPTRAEEEEDEEDMAANMIAGSLLGAAAGGFLSMLTGQRFAAGVLAWGLVVVRCCCVSNMLVRAELHVHFQCLS